MIKIRTFEADNLPDFQTSVQQFCNENPNLNRQDVMKIYFTSIPIIINGSTRHLQTHGFIVYEDKEISESNEYKKAYEQ